MPAVGALELAPVSPTAEGTGDHAADRMAVDERGAFKQIAGLAIGFTISLDIFMGGALTGAA